MKPSALFSLLLFVSIVLVGCSSSQSSTIQQPEISISGHETQTDSSEIWKDYISGSTIISYTTKNENASLGYFGTVEVDINGKTIPYERYDYITKKSGIDQIVHGAIALFDSRYTEAVTQYFSGIVARPFEVSGDDSAGKGWIIFPDPSGTVTIKQFGLSAGDGSFEK